MKRPTRDWTLYLVPHTHVDIGYTEPPPIIVRKHAEFVARALDYCATTDPLPRGERFCWTCEVSWTVKAFLARYPERAREFFRRVREGRIEVTAMYLQVTDLFGQELLEETLDYAIHLGRQQGFEVVAAMNDDVNGWAWGLPYMLRRRGVRYFDAAINETRALGVRPRPRPFHWASPDGSAVLMWHGDSYLLGNSLEFDRPDAGARVAAYLRRLEDGGYPHRAAEIRIHGANHDNAPPGLWISRMAHDWNRRHANPKLRVCTARAWFEELEAHWPAAIPVHRAAWPDWWADGNGSAAFESALVRTAQADLKTAGVLAKRVAPRRAPGVEGGILAERFAAAREAAAFFCEHTWGAWCSTDAPDSVNSRTQWNGKAHHAYAAAAEANGLVRDLMATAAESKDRAASLLVFNPLPHARTDLVEAMVSDADIGVAAARWIPGPTREDPGPACFLLDAERGVSVPVAREPMIADSARRPAQIVRFVARDVPPHGFRTYRIIMGRLKGRTRCGWHRGVLESPFVRVELHPHGRGVRRVVSKDSRTAWVRPHPHYALGTVVYEHIPGPFGREKLAAWSGIRRDCRFRRTPIVFGPARPLGLPGGWGVRLEARRLAGSLQSLALDVAVYDDLPRVDLTFCVEKRPQAQAESLYVAFPLAGERPLVWLDVPGAVMRPGSDQVPGTATDWHSIQHYFAVADRRQTVAVASPDISLVQVNGINTGKWQETLPPHNGVVMSWVFNNYWFTNFPAAQGGTLRWRYSLTAWPGAFDAGRCTRFAQAVRQPLVAATAPGRAAPAREQGQRKERH
jgi:hypothetical protein